jgi:hypothetical protein
MELTTILLIILAIFIAYFVFLYFTQTPAKDAMVAAAVPVVTASVPVMEVQNEPEAESEPQPEQHSMRRHVPNDAEYQGEEGPLDPYAEDQEHAEMPERMRRPERMFKPAPENDGMPVNSGLMGAPHAGVAGYASEMVQNEGEFMPGIVAFDSGAEGGNFSMF